MDGSPEATDNTFQPHSDGHNREKLRLSFPKIPLFLSFVSAVGLGILIQLLISKLTLIYYGDTRPSAIGNDLFSQPPRQQHLVRFPTDISYYSAQTDLSTKEDDGADEQCRHEIRNHESLDSYTIQRVKEKRRPTENIRAEAHASYKAALEMMDHGKSNKAKKLLQHAIYLDPLDPDILNAFGEFLIATDVMQADHMFKQAIIISPSHSKALVNIQRTAPVVQEMEAAAYNRIDHKLDLLIHVPENHPALRRLKKELYYKHIYHTVAIEGSTLNLHQTRAIIETRVAIGGKSLAEQNEVIGMDAALTYINNTLLNRIGKISVQDVLEIHRRVLGFVDPIEAGQMRNTQVFVGDYIPPRANEVQALMEEFIEWLNSDETGNLHPIKLAAIAHYKLVTIHPFYDGNGRTSRLLMNLVLMHAGYPPVMIKVEEKHEYYRYLETANQGDIRPFIRFIAKCTERTIDEYMTALTNTEDHSHDIARYSHGNQDDERIIIIDNLDDEDEM